MSELEHLYRNHWKFVRGLLLALGVSAADLDDLGHEIFLVAAKKHPETPLDLTAQHRWLRKITQYVVLGYRRRAFRRLEVRASELDEPASDPAIEAALAEREETDLLHVALGRLDPQEIDILALHSVGQLSFRTLGEISDCDPKTARRKFLRALRRARVLLSDTTIAAPLPPEVGSPGASQVGSTGGSETGVVPDLNLEGVDECLAMGTAGRTLIGVWRGTITEGTLELLLMIGHRVRESRGSGFPYLAIVEKTCHAPGLAARTKMLEVLRLFRDDLTAYATVPSAASYALPIMSALAVLARVPFPMRFFGNVDEAGQWLFEAAGSTTGLASAPELIQAANRLRLLVGVDLRA